MTTLKGDLGMKKLIIIASIFIFTFAIAIGVKADGMQLKNIDTIMAEIRLEQGVQSNKSIDVSKVSQTKLEELGDSVMEKIIGNTAMHDQMDINLGGDGSANLTSVHTRIGYDYLKGYPINMMTFMGGNMMGYNNFNGYGNMMGNFGWGGLIIGFLLFILVIAVVIYAISSFNRPHNVASIDSAMEIAKQRYAKGEITKEEFESIKERLK